MVLRKLQLLVLLAPLFAFSQKSEEIEDRIKLSGQWRTYYMKTLNKENLKDYEALATGGKIKFQLMFNERFELGAALYNSTNLGLQDLTIPDATTGKLSRYEEGLFDRLNLENDVVILLGELYAAYTLPKHEFKLGRMKINTPLINPEDGRMIPTLVQGFWYKHKAGKGNSVQIGLLNEIAPRSTGRFYDIGSSIGTYPVGRNNGGQPSMYPGNTNSDFIALLNTNLIISNGFKIVFWNYYTQNISNSIYLKPSLELSENFRLTAEWLHQNRIGDGGNAIDSVRYFSPISSDVVGLQMAYRWKKSTLSLGYDHILPHGQFLSPREWGREGLFSFQKRERSEGSADNHALVLNYLTSLPIFKDKAELNSLLSIGRHWKPSVLDAVTNKYAVPDYTHINLDFFFNFKKLPNLKPEVLFTTKLAHGDVPDNPNFYFNKTDLLHIDLILNYNF